MAKLRQYRPDKRTFHERKAARKAYYEKHVKGVSAVICSSCENGTLKFICKSCKGYGFVPRMPRTAEIK